MNIFYPVIVPTRRVYVIAEVGSNHGGQLDEALAYIKACADAGADAVKFQSWNTRTLHNALTTSGAEEPAIAVLEHYELPVQWHEPLKQACDYHGVDFLSTPFDLERARQLRETGCPAFKIASGDLTYAQLLEEVGGYGLPVLLSTGMATLGEIEDALEALGPARSRTTLLHCVGAYPPALEDANLRAIVTLAQAFGLPVGLSDHYPGYATVVAGVALGATVIEKHVTFSRDAGHPDSPFALEINEFAEMVCQIRNIERALGDGLKTCRDSEAGGRIGGRRSLYWQADLGAGQRIEAHHVAALRPARGELAPADLDTAIGRVLTAPVSAGMPVSWRDLADA